MLWSYWKYELWAGDKIQKHAILSSNTERAIITKGCYEQRWFHFFEQPQKADGVPEDFSHKIIDLS